MTVWSPQQDDALKAVSAWLKQKRGPQVFRLFGYAGTGKTTLARELAEGVDGDVAFCAFTGKAAHVMRQKGCWGASTIHSRIYKLDDQDFTGEPRFKLDPEADIGKADLVIIDEVSMVGDDLAKDLLSFGVKVLVLGDPAQLPPVKGEGFFTNAEPDVMLTEVHRQAEGSPIIRLATAVRQGAQIVEQRTDGCDVIAFDRNCAELALSHDQILCGRNKTRHRMNARVRELKGIASPTPIQGEKLVCLRNDRIKKLLNGSIWTVSDALKRGKKDREVRVTPLEVLPEEATDSEAKGVKIRVKDAFWNGLEADLSWEDKRGFDEFTFGYALTCHKSQGSQWDSVFIFDEGSVFREDAWRWRYTAITRAAKRLTMVLS